MTRLVAVVGTTGFYNLNIIVIVSVHHGFQFFALRSLLGFGLRSRISTLACASGLQHPDWVGHLHIIVAFIIRIAKLLWLVVVLILIIVIIHQDWFAFLTSLIVIVVIASKQRFSR